MSDKEKDASLQESEENQDASSETPSATPPVEETPEEESKVEESVTAEAASDSEETAGKDEAPAPAAGDGGTPPPPPAKADSTSDDSGSDDDEENDDEDLAGSEMSFLDHLSELRKRLTYSCIAIGIGFLACYGFSKQLFELLMRPLIAVFPPDSKLIFTALPEAFFTYIKVALVAGVLITSPYLFYQIWCFIAPGLYAEERKHLLPVAFFSGFFFVLGASFGYYVVFPFAFEFFMSFATETIQPMPSLSEYLSFSLKLLFAFGLVFELPLFIFFLARLGLVTAAKLRKIRKYAILCSFIIAAILTPPDVISQTLMAGPLLILFELSIWVAHFFGKKPKEEPKDGEEEEEDAEEKAEA